MLDHPMVWGTGSTENQYDFHLGYDVVMRIHGRDPQSFSPEFLRRRINEIDRYKPLQDYWRGIRAAYKILLASKE